MRLEPGPPRLLFGQVLAIDQAVRLALHGVQPANLCQRPMRRLWLHRPRLKEFPPRVRPAQHLMDFSAGVDPVVPGKRIGLQVSLKFLQEGCRTVPFATGRVVIHRIRIPPVSTVDPEPGRARLRQRRVEHRHRRVVGVNDCRAADPLDHQPVQRLQNVGRLQRPAAERAA